MRRRNQLLNSGNFFYFPPKTPPCTGLSFDLPLIEFLIRFKTYS